MASRCVSAIPDLNPEIAAYTCTCINSAANMWQDIYPI